MTGETPTVDVQNARQVATLAGEEIRDLPTTRNIRSILTLTPGLTRGTGLGADCVGGVGVWCNNNIYNLSAHTATNDNDGGTQGRVMVDGTIINTGGGAGIMGMTGGYVADVANAQEVNVQISGALGESETGGASINIIPRTGGNRFSGNYFTSFTRGDYNLDGSLRDGGLFSGSWFSKNNGSYPEIVERLPAYPRLRHVGGVRRADQARPSLVLRARRAPGRRTRGAGRVDRIWDNKNAGIWGANYQADRSQGPLTLMNMTRNGNARITYQMSQKNKFNFFWDEGLTCQDPCDGSVAPWTARDGWWSGQVHPARLIQASWTNPLTNVILLEAGLAANRQLYDFSQHRYYTPNPDIPRVVEFGVDRRRGRRVGGAQSHDSATIIGVPSGPWADGIGGAAEQRQPQRLAAARVDLVRHRPAQRQVRLRRRLLRADPGQQNRQHAPGVSLLHADDSEGQTTCYNAANPAASTCGNTSLYYPNDPFNQARRPVPDRVTINTGPSTIDNRVSYTGFYVQDQWTLKRFTLSGAIRYDHATSSYPETCIQGIDNGLTQGNGNEPYVPVQVGGAFAGQKGYCTAATRRRLLQRRHPAVGRGVGRLRHGQDVGQVEHGQVPLRRPDRRHLRRRQPGRAHGQQIHPDLDGRGRRPHRRLRPAELRRADRGGRRHLRRADFGRRTRTACGTGATRSAWTDGAARRLVSPRPSADAGKQVFRRPCRPTATSTATACSSGSGKRRSEWQFGLGIQHELLPRFSAEVTYNRRSYSNLTVTDQLGVGCDRFNGALDLRTCNENYLNFNDPTSYDFYSVVAPSQSSTAGWRRLRDSWTVQPPSSHCRRGQPSAVTIMDELAYTWNGVDTNFVWRGTNKWGLRGLRVNGGTSTGRAVRDLCYAIGERPGRPAARRRDAPSATRIRGGTRTSEAAPPTRFPRSMYS